MKYVFNPKSRQINPATEMTFVDPTLRDKVVSAELYALVCKGKVSLEDIAAMFAVGKSPEILLKNHTAVKDSPFAKAPAATVTLPPEDAEKQGEGGPADDELGTVGGAFSKGDLWKKPTADLMILANTVGIDTSAEGFVPTRKGLVDAILERAAAAEATASEPAPTTPPPAE